MAKLITIDDSNYMAHMAPPAGRKKGGVRRNFQSHPQGYLGPVAEPFSLQVFQASEIEARIQEQEQQQNHLQSYRDTGNYGQRMPSYDQNGKGYCWAHSSTSAVTLVRATQNCPYVPLSAYMVACIIKNYQDQGGWGAESLKFIAETGIAPASVWPMQSMSRSNDTPAMRAEAAKFKVTEWWDLSEDRNTVKAQLATLLLLNVPVVVDFNWWSHSVCAVRLIKWNPFTIRIWNSWGDTWSDAGMGDLTDSKAIPDGAVAPRVMLAA